MTETRSVIIERELAYPPELVWQALTEPALIEDWLMVSDFRPEVDHRFRFTANGQPAAMEAVIRAYLDEVKGYAKSGRTPPKDESEPDLPDELLEALDADPELAEAFFALTRGRRKSYVINLNSARKSETRVQRIATFRDKIIAGKGAMER